MPEEGRHHDIEPLWRTYGMVAEWIKAADQKAGIMLALVTAAATALGALAIAESRPPMAWPHVLLIGGSGVSGVLCAWYCILALLPRLDSAQDQEFSAVRSAGNRVGRFLTLLKNSVRPGTFAFGDPADSVPEALSAEDALFYMRIAEANLGQLIDAFKRLHEDTICLQQALSMQLLAVSRIARHKFLYLQYATAWLLVGAVFNLALWTAVVMRATADGTPP